jgi:hypothetical protein
LLTPIRNDDVGKLHQLIADGNKYRVKIPWSIYEQFLRWDFQVPLKEKGADLSEPEICQAIGLLGGSACFTTFCQQEGPDRTANAIDGLAENKLVWSMKRLPSDLRQRYYLRNYMAST